MIYVTRLNHTSVVLNSDLIEHIETTPDTIISLTTGEKLVVLESAEEIIDRVVEYRKKCHPAVWADTMRSPVEQKSPFEVRTETHGRR